MTPGNNDTELGGMNVAGLVVDGEGNGIDENGLGTIVEDGLIAYDVSREVRADEAFVLGGYIGRVCGTFLVEG